MRARGVSVVLLLVLGLAAWLAPPTRADVAALRAYEGTWAYADGDRGRRAIERAVARAVEGLPFFAEPIAANAVRQMTGPFERIVFTVEHDRLEFRADAWGPVGARVGGRGERIPGPDGRTPLVLRQYLDGGRLVQIFEHPDGSRRNTLALSGDGQWLWMSVVISSPRLPADCRYRLRYHRLEAPQLAGR
ncbi:MAG TPA: hypothetical protein VIL20_00635 [Sandaracinaceae bacterium]